MPLPRRAGGFYDTPEWRSVRKAALSRDHWACTACGASLSGKGQSRVDHIQPLRTRPDLGLSLDNLRCLCPKCDNKRHGEKGQWQRPESTFVGCNARGEPNDPRSHWYKEKPKNYDS